MSAIAEIRLRRWQPDGPAREVPDHVAVEEPLEIRVGGVSIAVVMRTPGNDSELAAGFLLTEGIIRSPRDLFDIAPCRQTTTEAAGNTIDVTLSEPGRFDAAALTRHVFTSSSCGVCSKATIAAVMKRRRRLRDPFTVAPQVILDLPAQLSGHQAAFDATGGLHSCSLFDSDGQLVAVREDVGRHNALDKLCGWALLHRHLPLRGHVLLLSGRASFEMMQKAHAGGIAVIAAIGAPSSLAVEFAKSAGQTLVGFLRTRSMNLYSCPERIADRPAARPPAAKATRRSSARRKA